MKRQIKFRGRHLESGIFVYGNLIIGEIEGRKFYQIEHSVAEDFEEWQVDPETVGQLTGLKDSFGKDIYEGDIVRHRLCGARKADKVVGEVRIESSRGVCVGYWPIAFEEEVIGNIHENPELLQPERADGKRS